MGLGRYENIGLLSYLAFKILVHIFREIRKMDYVYVALFDGLPVVSAHTILHIEDMLAEYTKGTMLKYEAHNPKYPDDLQGWYTYKDIDGDEIQFKLYIVDYK